MESLDRNIAGENTSFVSDEVKNYLIETAKWGKFLAIIGYIGIGLLLLVAAVVMVMGSTSKLFPGMGMNMGALGLIYVAITGLYFFPVYYLHQFSVKIRQGLTTQDHQSIATGFQNMKSLFKFMGISTIVILSIYALIFVIAMVAGLASAM